MKRALFLDRDGVINVDRNYVGYAKDFEVIDGVFDALHRAQARDYILLVVTNQSGIARGYYSHSDYFALENHMRMLFSTEGITFAGIYHCPHYPGGVVPEFSVACGCRKPLPGMILQAAHEHDVDLARSVMVGDKESDAQAARASGIGKIHLLMPPEFTLADVILD